MNIWWNSELADSALIPATERFDSGFLPVSVITIWQAIGGWHATAVLYRTGKGEVVAHPPWDKPYGMSLPSPWLSAWGLLADTILTKGGGNHYGSHIDGFEVAKVSHIAKVITARTAEVIGSPFGPHGPVKMLDTFDLPDLGDHN